MIGIIAAMQEEAAYLSTIMTDRITSQGAQHVFHTGKINGTDVVLLQCGIGKVNAAIGTTLMIERFKPRYIINTGSAGGINSALHIGDVVISREVRHHDVDVTAFGYEHGQVPQLPAAFTANSVLIDSALVAAQSLNMPVTQGLIISGDSFMHHEARITHIRSLFPDAQAVEMEAAAVAQVCHQFQVPFVIIRALSDIAGQDSAVSFKEFLEQAAQNSAHLVVAMLKAIDPSN